MFERVLRSSIAYEGSRRLIGAHREMEALVEDHIRPESGMRILDLGCGNGRLVPFLHDVEYVGIDHNSSYIKAATERFSGPRVTFFCGEHDGVTPPTFGQIDVIVLLGVLHHLDDAVVRAVLAAAFNHLDPTGRLVTMDPCFEPNQSPIARVLMALDRGKCVRHPADYLRLIERATAATHSTIRSDMYKFPYTHLITESTAESSGALK